MNADKQCIAWIEKADFFLRNAIKSNSKNELVTEKIVNAQLMLDDAISYAEQNIKISKRKKIKNRT